MFLQKSLRRYTGLEHPGWGMGEGLLCPFPSGVVTPRSPGLVVAGHIPTKIFAIGMRYGKRNI